ncbi:hypothetical protein BCR35DRAFT_327520 [Leucosporidium creatinivorum]|uniref:Uncharacterized protein n=1 Tax=Leucosporidium creatinivorum TaxID=106004 RepID=A0A1Y2G4W6_9BASI|nr:hypothetical protein BCR35DRAFT_327520 [Leucosporidium creatinivorum]
MHTYGGHWLTLYLQSGKCAACPTESYGDDSTHVCAPCSNLDPDAASCTATTVLSCKSLSLKPDGTCGSCAQGYYSARFTRICTRCPDPFAVTCQDFSGASTSCGSGFFLMPGAFCTSTCPAGFYGDTQTLECAPCGATFPLSQTCTSNGPLTCFPPFHLINNECATCSIQGSAFTYYNYDTGFCQAPAPGEPPVSRLGGFFAAYHDPVNGHCFCGEDLMTVPHPTPSDPGTANVHVLPCNALKTFGMWNFDGPVCEDVVYIGRYCYVVFTDQLCKDFVLQ